MRTAVPDGASTLPAWCSSITSTESKNRAAWRANCMASTAPTPKLGATSTCPGRSASQPRTRVEPGGVEAAGADDGGDAVVEGEAHVVQRGTGMRDVDDDLRAGVGQRVQGVAPVDLRHELQVRGAVDGPADLGAHPAAGAQHAHPDRLAHGRRA